MRTTTARAVARKPISRTAVSVASRRVASENTSPRVATRATATKKRKVSFSKIFTAFVLLLCVSYGLYSAGTNAYSYYVDKQFADTEKRDKKILTDLGDILLLPGAKPTIYIIDNPEQLKARSSFFTNLAKGDAVLFFNGQDNSSTVVIYRYKQDIIVNMGVLMQNSNMSSGPGVAPPQSNITNVKSVSNINEQGGTAATNNNTQSSSPENNSNTQVMGSTGINTGASNHNQSAQANQQPGTTVQSGNVSNSNINAQ